MAVDQVPRLERWRAEHPEILITVPDYGAGGTLWGAHKDGAVIAAEYNLERFLDTLDALMSSTGAAS